MQGNRRTNSLKSPHRYFAIIGLHHARRGLGGRRDGERRRRGSGVRISPSAPLPLGPYRTHGLRFIPKTWVTLWPCRAGLSFAVAPVTSTTPNDLLHRGPS